MINCYYAPLHFAVLSALASGLDRADILSVVSDALAPPLSTPLSSASEPMLIYETLPPGLIPLPTANTKYGLKRGRLTMWLKRGKLHNKGRIKGAAPGGGFILIEEAALLALLHSPPKNGRPKKFASP